MFYPRSDRKKLQSSVRFYLAFTCLTMGGLTFLRILYPQKGHFISGVIANWSAVSLDPQLIHS